MLTALLSPVTCDAPVDEIFQTRVKVPARLLPASVRFTSNQGKHILEEWADLGEEMSRVQGAVVVRRPDLIDVSSTPPLLAPASDLDFVRTLQSYFPLFQSSLFPRYTYEILREGEWRGSWCMTQTMYIHSSLFYLPGQQLKQKLQVFFSARKGQYRFSAGCL